MTSILKKVYNYYIRRKNPIQYWRMRGASIGDNCEIYFSTTFGSEPYLITIGNHVRINAGVQLITHDGGCWVLRGMKSELSDVDLFGRIFIGDNCHIGTNAMIMPGVIIGKNCIVGCGAIVTKDVPNNSIVAGVPARIIETIDDYECKHKGDFDFTKHLTYVDKKQYLCNKYNILT